MLSAAYLVATESNLKKKKIALLNYTRIKTATEASVKREYWIYMRNLYILHCIATQQNSDSAKLFKKCGYSLYAIPETWFW